MTILTSPLNLSFILPSSSSTLLFPYHFILLRSPSTLHLLYFLIPYYLPPPFPPAPLSLHSSSSTPSSPTHPPYITLPLPFAHPLPLSPSIHFTNPTERRGHQRGFKLRVYRRSAGYPISDHCQRAEGRFWCLPM